MGEQSTRCKEATRHEATPHSELMDAIDDADSSRNMSSESYATSAASPPPLPPSCLLEVCVDSVASARTAESSGASRVELCSALLEGGLTPSAGLISAVCKAVRIPVMVLIRPRAGDFCYDSDEFSIILHDIHLALSLGATGVVCGVLMPDGTIDETRTAQILETVQAADEARTVVHGLPSADAAASPSAVSAPAAPAPSAPLQLTFHRAIDLAADLPAALAQLVRLGVRRVLTSGGCADAMAGAEVIAELVRQSAGRIAIVAGGGVTESNIIELLRRTGVREVHGSLRSTVDGAMQYRKAGVFMGGEKRNDSTQVEYATKQADGDKIRMAVEGIKQAAGQ